MNTFSIKTEIDRLTPVDLGDEPPPLIDGESLISQWDQVTKNLARLGKQQLRSNQTVEFLESQLRETQERADEYRREATRLREESYRTASTVLEVLDTLDDVTVLARQMEDTKWISNLERLASKTLRVFEQLGIAEISAPGEAYNPEEHDALDTVAPVEGQHPHQITQVIRRGFRYKGSVLRRAEVITTR